MGDFHAEVVELQRAQALLKLAERKLSDWSPIITRAYHRLDNQQNATVTNVRGAIVGWGRIYDAQWERIQKMISYIDTAMAEMEQAEEQAYKELADAEIREDKKESGNTISQKPGQSAGTNNSGGATQNEGSAIKNSTVQHKYYYNLGEWQAGKGVNNAEAACLTCTWTMILNGLGVNVTPMDIYRLNGNTVFLNNAKVMQQYGLVKETIPVANESGETTKRLLYEALQKNPQGVALRNKADTHSIYVYLNAQGEIVFNDPGLSYGEGIKNIERCLQFSGWNDIKAITILNFK